MFIEDVLMVELRARSSTLLSQMDRIAFFHNECAPYRMPLFESLSKLPNVEFEGILWDASLARKNVAH